MAQPCQGLIPQDLGFEGPPEMMQDAGEMALRGSVQWSGPACHAQIDAPSSDVMTALTSMLIGCSKLYNAHRVLMKSWARGCCLHA